MKTTEFCPFRISKYILKGYHIDKLKGIMGSEFGGIIAPYVLIMDNNAPIYVAFGILVGS